MHKILPISLIILGAFIAVLVLNPHVWSAAWNKIGTLGKLQDQNVKNASSGVVAVKQVRPVPIVPKEKTVMQVAQAAEVLPRILEAMVDPPSVKVGQKQNLYVIVSDPNPIVSAVAEIKTDHKTVTVQLNFEGEVSASQMMPMKYFVDNNHKLTLADGKNNAGLVFADEPKLKYSGSWTVKDTHDIEYITTFIVKDDKGNINSVPVNWVDPCGSISFTDNINNTINSSCSLSITDGVNGGNITIDVNGAVTIGSAGILVYNSGKSLTINPGGSITITSGGQIKKGWLAGGTDSDGDTYPGSFSYSATSASRSNSNTDCNDSNNKVHPGGSIYYSTATTTNMNLISHAYDGAGEVNYDYNCDGSETKQYEALSSLSCPNDSSGPTCSAPNSDQTYGNVCAGGIGSTGWISSVPACGVSGNFDESCSWTETQSCSFTPALGYCDGTKNTQLQAQTCI